MDLKVEGLGFDVLFLTCPHHVCVGLEYRFQCAGFIVERVGSSFLCVGSGHKDDDVCDQGSEKHRLQLVLVHNLSIRFITRGRSIVESLGSEV